MTTTKVSPTYAHTSRLSPPPPLTLWPPNQRPPEPPKLTKAQRQQRTHELNKQIWRSADDDTHHRNLWLEARGAVSAPMPGDFKPPVQVLSRKPPVAAAADDGDEDSADETRRRDVAAAALVERQRTAKLEREEKERKYAEARARIMGPSPSPARDGSTSTPHRRSRPRNEGGRHGGPASSAEASPAGRALFDPSDAGRRPVQRETNGTAGEVHPSRQPRGPEASARGGFGAAMRGARSGV